MISRGLISAEVATQLLRSYHIATPVLPFISVPPDANLDYMRQERPCLLHAILTASSQDQLQKRLESEFRKMVAEQVVVKSEKSLDILQGLITYIAW